MVDNSIKIVYLTVIADRKKKDAIVKAIQDIGVKLINVMYAKGSVKSDYLRDMLGFVPEEHKVMITSLLLSEKSDKLLDMLLEKFEFNKPNTGIAFTIPIEYF